MAKKQKNTVSAPVAPHAANGFEALSVLKRELPETEIAHTLSILEQDPTLKAFMDADLLIAEAKVNWMSEMLHYDVDNIACEKGRTDIAIEDLFQAVKDQEKEYADLANKIGDITYVYRKSVFATPLYAAVLECKRKLPKDVYQNWLDTNDALIEREVYSKYQSLLDRQAELSIALEPNRKERAALMIQGKDLDTKKRELLKEIKAAEDTVPALLDRATTLLVEAGLTSQVAGKYVKETYDAA